MPNRKFVFAVIAKKMKLSRKKLLFAISNLSLNMIATTLQFFQHAAESLSFDIIGAQLRPPLKPLSTILSLIFEWLQGCPALGLHEYKDYGALTPTANHSEAFQGHVTSQSGVRWPRYKSMACWMS